MPKVTEEQAAQELIVVTRAWTTAVGSAVKDYAYFDRHLAEGWRYTDFNGVVRGKDEYLKLIDNMVWYTQDFHRFDVRLISDDIAVATGVYRSRVELTSGTKGDNTIAFTALWQLQDGVWKAVLHHTTRITEPSPGWPR